MLQILQSKAQIYESRKVLRAKNWSTIGGLFDRARRRFKLGSGLTVGDMVKSWDVLQSLDFLDKHLSKQDVVVDFGAYCSEVPVALNKMGFSKVYGVDLNPEIKLMPHAEDINYVISDFLESPLENHSAQAVTAISVIEHGYQPQRLFKEVSRLLADGGYFIASFDYWPEKINVGSTKFFGMDWRIFSREEITEMVQVASEFGLFPVGKMEDTAASKPIHCAGFGYTFGWIVFQKRSA